MRYVAPVLTRLLSALLALALVAAGVVVLVELAAALEGSDRVVVSQAAVDGVGRRHWDDAAVILTLVALAGVGLAAVAAGLWPRPPLLLPSSFPSAATGGDVEPHPGADGPAANGGNRSVAVERRSLEHVLGDELRAVEGVTDARVRAGRTRMAARVDANRRLAPPDLDDQVRRVVSGQLARCGLVLDTTVRVRRRPAGGSGDVAATGRR